MSKNYQNISRCGEAAAPGSSIAMLEPVQVAMAEIASSMKDSLLTLVVSGRIVRAFRGIPSLSLRVRIPDGRVRSES